MSFPQRLLQAILPRRLAEEMEAESRSWTVRCNACELERSVWELGGVRWKAAGRPSRLMRCPQCGRVTWCTLSRKQAGSGEHKAG
jgi:ribosomal protein S27E